EYEIHVDRAIWKIQTVREQQSVDRTGRPDDVGHVTLSREMEWQHGKQPRQNGCANARDEIELQKKPGAPDAFELGPEHPECQHVEQDVEDAGVQEHVSAQPPDLQLLNNHDRLEAQ